MDDSLLLLDVTTALRNGENCIYDTGYPLSLSLYVFIALGELHPVFFIIRAREGFPSPFSTYSLGKYT